MKANKETVATIAEKTTNLPCLVIVVNRQPSVCWHAPAKCTQTALDF